MIRTGSPGTVQWRTYMQGERTLIKGFETHVVFNEGAWQKLWQRMTGRDPSTAARDIDWNKDVLVVICLGQRNTGGYRVAVQGMTQKDASTILVKFYETAPAPGTVVPEALTQPYVIAKVQRPVGVFQFEKVQGPTVGTWPKITPPLNDDWNNTDTIPLRWSLLSTGMLAQAPARQTAVLDDASEYERYVTGVLGGSAPRDRINWSEEIVLAMHGEVSTGATTEVVVSRVMLDRRGTVAVFWTVDRDDAPSRERGSPYTLIRVPRYSTAPLFFRAR